MSRNFSSSSRGQPDTSQSSQFVPSSASDVFTGTGSSPPDTGTTGDETDPDPDACRCNPCLCETPHEREMREVGSNQSSFHYRMETPSSVSAVSSPINPDYKLNEFLRAKQLFLKVSSSTGLTLYDHLSDIIRKIMDERGPDNAVDFLEEISMNIKRYRFGLKNDPLRDSFYLNESELNDANQVVENWKKNASLSGDVAKTKFDERDKNWLGGFRNLLRFHYYLEQVGISLHKEEMFRIALSIREFKDSKPVKRIRFWGKIFGCHKNYYVIECELENEIAEDLWKPSNASNESEAEMTNDENESRPNTQVLGAVSTFNRAGMAVTDPEIVASYEDSSGQGENSEDVVANTETWEKYSKELMTDFPVPEPQAETEEIPPEEFGQGVNRRSYYICNVIGEKWILLPIVTPEQLIVSKQIGCQLTGNIDSKVSSPEFPGLEGNYLRAMLSRITSGTQVSPKGFFTSKPSKSGNGGGSGISSEDESEAESEVESEVDENESSKGNDTIYLNQNFKLSMEEVLDPSGKGWVHHVAHIIHRQGRNTPYIGDKQAGRGSDKSSASSVRSEKSIAGSPSQSQVKTQAETNPKLFSPLSEDKKSIDDVTPWKIHSSSSLFAEFQIAIARSNLWPGSIAICTPKGKVENIYIGHGQKLFTKMSTPCVPEETQREYKNGPDIQEMNEPTVEEENNLGKIVGGSGSESETEDEESENLSENGTSSEYESGTETGQETEDDEK